MRPDWLPQDCPLPSDPTSFLPSYTPQGLEPEQANERLEPFRTANDWLHGPWWQGLMMNDAPPTWDNLEKYLHIAYGEADPLRRRHSDVELALEVDAEVEAWQDKVLELLADEELRTFNAIVLELTGQTMSSDMVIGRAPEQAIWRLVSLCQVANTTFCPVLFSVVQGPEGPPQTPTPG